MRDLPSEEPPSQEEVAGLEVTGSHQGNNVRVVGTGWGSTRDRGSLNERQDVAV